VPDGLDAVLLRARDLGFLGPGDPATHRVHAQGFAEAYLLIEGSAPRTLCDLGAGGGVPGLVLAERWPSTMVVLLEASERRCGFLRASIDELGWNERVSVAQGRAEQLARRAGLEGEFPLVTARSFGPPAATAECAVRLLADGGILLVAEPPSDDAAGLRWPTPGLKALGFGVPQPAGSAPHLVAIRRDGPCPHRFPRRDGVPAKRPLF
jgi:16S rRNA (guanine527-N7)-methyltransferase